MYFASFMLNNILNDKVTVGKSLKYKNAQNLYTVIGKRKFRYKCYKKYRNFTK